MTAYMQLSKNDTMANGGGNEMNEKIDAKNQRFPYCIVWTPIPLLTWLFPFIGHMGIGTSEGVIRDFAGPYYVSEGNMAFGEPTRYLKLQPHNAENGAMGWDAGVREASDIYGKRMHNLCCDNCHSHVATALEWMHYNNTTWNMIKLAGWMFVFGRYVNMCGFFKTWLPFFVMMTVILCVIFVPKY